MNIELPWPDRVLHPNKWTRWSAEASAELVRLHGSMTIAALAAHLGTTVGAVRGKITGLGIAKKENYPDALLRELREIYAAAGTTGYLGLKDIAAKWGKDEGNLARKAGQLGLATSHTRAKVGAKKIKVARYSSAEERNQATSERVKALWASRPHPRGALGMKHSEETKAIISRKSAAAWASCTQERREERRLKAERTRRENGLNAPHVRRGKWYAGWREIGGKRIYFRSRWEANYARYLEWLKVAGQISDWDHEPHTFWFDGVRRGCVSYLPDFKVTNLGGDHEWHEVKGWMDARSATALKRMAKYHPAEKIVVIRDKQYREIRRKVAAMTPGWEDEAKRKDWANWKAPVA